MITLDSPLGPISIRADELVRELRVGGTAAAGRPSPLEQATAGQLGEYLAGERTEFALPLERGGSELQARVWALLETIPFGGTESYGGIARRLGLPPGAARAIGAAVGANPLLILRPCHRVLGANGSLTGYAGGLPAKEWLLRHEGVLL